MLILHCRVQEKNEEKDKTIFGYESIANVRGKRGGETKNKRGTYYS